MFLAVGAVALHAVAVFAFGGVHAGVRAGLHVGLALLLVATAVWMTDRGLARAGPALRWAAGCAALLGSFAIGFVPLVAPIRAVLAPGDPRTAFVTFATSSPDATLSAIANLLLPTGFGLVVAVIARHLPQQKLAERFLTALLALTLGVGFAHVLARQPSLFGLWPSGIRPFWAPFIDPSHFATLVLLATPSVAWAAFDPELPGARRVALLALTGAAVVAVVGAGSTGPAALVALGLLATLAGRSGRAAVALAPFAGLGAVALVALELGGGELSSLHGRLPIWAAAVRVWLGRWALGSGGGTFAAAVEPYRLDHENLRWTFAHDDYLQQLAETGLVGVALTLAGAWLLWPGRSRTFERTFPLDVGVGLVLGEALVEFPAQIPGITVAVAGVVAFRTVVYAREGPSSPRVVRAVLVVGAALELLAGLWCLRDREVRRATETLAAHPHDRPAVATLRRLAPWTPEYAAAAVLASALDVSPASAADGARSLAEDFPGSPLAQRVAAEVLTRVDPAAATAAGDRAVALGPADWRNWVARARAVTAAGDTEAAAEAWVDAVAAEAPPGHYREAFATLPVGVWWVDALEGGTPAQLARLADFLLTVDEIDAGLLAHEQAAAAGSREWSPKYFGALLETGSVDDAERHLLQALARSPDDARLRASLARLRERQGRWSEAAEVWLALARTQPRSAREAVLAVERAEGVDAAIRAARALQLDLPVPSAELRVEEARLERDAGRPERCMDLLALPLDAERVRSSERLLRSCRDAVAGR